ncbi:DEAD/DEAH box helicase [Oceanobacillus limi]|nr:DEAD/DEAH box helicase [Oceanobacillus limi]
MGRVMECTPLYFWSGESPNWPQHQRPCSWTGTLTEVQQHASYKIVQAVLTAQPELLVWAVCGAGKTEMLFAGITKALQLGKRICIATPRADVVRELLPRMKQAFSDITIQGLYGGAENKDGTAQLLIATTHQLLRFQEAFDVLIIDEIDAFPFHNDPSLLFASKRARKKLHTTIYLTATPRQEHRVQIDRNKLPHVFVPTRYHGHPLPIPTLSMCFSLRKDLKKKNPPARFVRWISKRGNPARQMLIFVPTIGLAEEMTPIIANLLLSFGIVTQQSEVTSVHSEDPNREAKIKSFRKKHLRVLLTTTILERGVTFPSVDVAVLDAGHTVFDEAALVQIAGRAGRSSDDPTGEVIFFHDGKTDAIVHAIRSIKQMNSRGGF